MELQALREVGHRGQRSAARRRRVRRRPVRDPRHEERSRGPLRGHARHSHRLGHVYKAEHRGLGKLWPRNVQPESAFVHRHRPADALRGQSGVGIGLPSRHPPGDAYRARPGPYSQPQAASRFPRDPGDGARASRFLQSPALERARIGRRSGRAHQVLRDRVQHAEGGA